MDWLSCVSSCWWLVSLHVWLVTVCQCEHTTTLGEAFWKCSRQTTKQHRKLECTYMLFHQTTKNIFTDTEWANLWRRAVDFRRNAMPRTANNKNAVLYSCVKFVPTSYHLALVFISKGCNKKKKFWVYTHVHTSTYFTCSSLSLSHTQTHTHTHTHIHT